MLSDTHHSSASAAPQPAEEGPAGKTLVGLDYSPDCSRIEARHNPAAAVDIARTLAAGTEVPGCNSLGLTFRQVRCESMVGAVEEKQVLWFARRISM